MSDAADFWTGATEDAFAISLLAMDHGAGKYQAIYRHVHALRRELLEDIQRNLVFLSHAVADELRERATGQRDEPGDHFGDRAVHAGEDVP